MISFIKQVVRQHFVIIGCAIFVGVFWPRLRQNLLFFAESDKSGLTTTNVGVDNNNNIRVLTVKELEQYDGIQKPQLYLALLGTVYDVTKGDKHYGNDGTYRYFTAKDASVAFITGDFEKAEDDPRDDADILNRLDAQEIYSLKQWQDFYEKEYKFVGRLEGNMYDKRGQPTDYHGQVLERIQAAIAEKQRDELLRTQYPPCNIEYKEETGTRVWCSKQSGGIDRSWPGYPRKYFQVGKTDYRCACVPHDRLDDPALREYDNCDASEISCYYRV